MILTEGIMKIKPKQIDETKVKNGLEIDTGELKAKKKDYSSVQGALVNPIDIDDSGIGLRVFADTFDINQEGFFVPKFGTGAGEFAAGNHTHSGMLSYFTPISGDCGTPAGPLPSTVNTNSIQVIINGVTYLPVVQTGHTSIPDSGCVFDEADKKIYFGVDFNSSDSYKILGEA